MHVDFVECTMMTERNVMDWHKNVLDTAALNVPYWIARYPSDDSGIMRPQLKPNRGECGWQYSSKGKVDGMCYFSGRHRIYLLS